MAYESLVQAEMQKIMAEQGMLQRHHHHQQQQQQQPSAKQQHVAAAQRSRSILPGMGGSSANVGGHAQPASRLDPAELEARARRREAAQLQGEVLRQQILERERKKAAAKEAIRREDALEQERLAREQGQLTSQYAGEAAKEKAKAEAAAQPEAMRKRKERNERARTKHALMNQKRDLDERCGAAGHPNDGSFVLEKGETCFYRGGRDGQGAWVEAVCTDKHGEGTFTIVAAGQKKRRIPTTQLRYTDPSAPVEPVPFVAAMQQPAPHASSMVAAARSPAGAAPGAATMSAAYLHSMASSGMASSLREGPAAFAAAPAATGAAAPYVPPPAVAAAAALGSVGFQFGTVNAGSANPSLESGAFSRRRELDPEAEDEHLKKRRAQLAQREALQIQMAEREQKKARAKEAKRVEEAREREKIDRDRQELAASAEAARAKQRQKEQKAQEQRDQERAAVAKRKEAEARAEELRQAAIAEREAKAATEAAEEAKSASSAAAPSQIVRSESPPMPLRQELGEGFESRPRIQRSSHQPFRDATAPEQWPAHDAAGETWFPPVDGNVRAQASQPQQYERPQQLAASSEGSEGFETRPMLPRTPGRRNDRPSFEETPSLQLQPQRQPQLQPLPQPKQFPWHQRHQLFDQNPQPPFNTVLSPLIEMASGSAEGSPLWQQPQQFVPPSQQPMHQQRQQQMQQQPHFSQPQQQQWGGMAQQFGDDFDLDGSLRSSADFVSASPHMRRLGAPPMKAQPLPWTTSSAAIPPSISPVRGGLRGIAKLRRADAAQNEALAFSQQAQGQAQAAPFFAVDEDADSPARGGVRAIAKLRRQHAAEESRLDAERGVIQFPWGSVKVVSNFDAGTSAPVGGNGNGSSSIDSSLALLSQLGQVAVAPSFGITAEAQQQQQQQQWAEQQQQQQWAEQQWAEQQQQAAAAEQQQQQQQYAAAEAQQQQWAIEVKQQQATQEAAALSLQRVQRGRIASVEAQRRRLAIEAKQELDAAEAQLQADLAAQNSAAVTLQARVRGKRQRWSVKVERQRAAEKAAAVTLQSRLRARLARQQYAAAAQSQLDLVAQNEAAVKLQSVQRGKHQRFVAEAERTRDAAEAQAAIQRAQVELERARYAAAVTLQSAERTRLANRAADRARFNYSIKANAAVTLQAVQRGGVARKNAQRSQQAATTLQRAERARIASGMARDENAQIVANVVFTRVNETRPGSASLEYQMKAPTAVDTSRPGSAAQLLKM